MNMRILRLFIILFLLAPATVTWARSDHSKGHSEDQKEIKKSLDDDEMDNGEADDKSDEPSDKSKFKEDSDDSYEETAEGKDDSDKSKFKEGKDEDDQETDDSDQD